MMTPEEPWQKIFLYSVPYDAVEQKASLKRVLGLLEVTLSGMGVILGAGIYALLGQAAALAGNALWLSFLWAGLVALCSGLSYAELSSMMPRASAEYEYSRHAFGREVAFVVGWLIILSGIISSATVALGFAGYFGALFGTPTIPSALLLILSLSVLLLAGIKQSARVAVIFTLIEAAGLIIVIILGLPHYGAVDYLKMPHGLDGIFAAAALIFFAYLGFEEMVKLSEETRDPEVNIPRGLVLAVLAAAVLYLLVAVSAVSILGWQRLAESKAPFADIALAAVGRRGFFLLSIIALFSTTNTVLLMLLAASRIVYGMASSSALPRAFARVHPATGAPWAATLAVILPSLAFVLLQDIGFVANVANFTLFLSFIVINAALIVLRFNQPEIKRPFRVPLAMGKMPLIPLLAIAFNAFMLAQLSFQVLLMGSFLALLGGLAAMIKRYFS
jgi:APA family basic amino acid/polyamine antiporter